MIVQSTSDLVALTCGECGILFAVPQHWDKVRREKGDRFHCPNGHVRVYRESEVDKLKKELLRKQADLDQEKARADDNFKWATKAEQAKRRLQTEKKNLKKRIGNGVCPCCNRTVSQLARHMETKHPEYKGS